MEEMSLHIKHACCFALLPIWLHFRVTLDVSTFHPWQLVEGPPALPPLQVSMTDEEYQVQQQKEQKRLQVREVLGHGLQASRLEIYAQNFDGP